MGMEDGLGTGLVLPSIALMASGIANVVLLLGLTRLSEKLQELQPASSLGNGCYAANDENYRRNYPTLDFR